MGTNARNKLRLPGCRCQQGGRLVPAKVAVGNWGALGMRKQQESEPYRSRERGTGLTLLGLSAAGCSAGGV